MTQTLSHCSWYSSCEINYVVAALDTEEEEENYVGKWREHTHVNVLVAAKEVLGHMYREDVGQQFPVIRLQVFHVLFFFCCL